MFKFKKIISFIMVFVLCLSNANFGAYVNATEYPLGITAGYPYGRVESWESEINGIASVMIFSASKFNVEWSNSNERVAKLEVIDNNECQVTAISPGTTTITATVIETGETASIQYTAKGIALYEEMLMFNYGSLNLEKSEMKKIIATVEPASSTLVWSSSDERVAVVNQNGEVTAVGAGSATITAKIQGSDKFAQLVATVIEKQTIRITSGSNDTSEIGNPKALNMATTPSNSTVVWSSADEKIAKVNKDGIVTGINAGKVVITATISGTNISDSCNFTVKPSTVVEKTITMHENTASSEVGVSKLLYVKTTPSDTAVTWSSSNERIATVNRDGKVTPIAEGTTIITATIGGTDISDSCKFTVIPVEQKIKISEESWSGDVGYTTILSATATPSDSKIVWSSSNEKVATVNQNGKVTGVNAGTATITAKISGTNIAADCIVIVTANTVDQTIRLSNDSTIINTGATATLSATTTPSDSKIIWSSSNEKVATVNQNGKVTGVSAGTATITAKIDGTNSTAKCVVTVNAAQLVKPTVKMNVSSLSLQEEVAQTLYVTTTPSNTEVLWSSSNEKIAKVDKFGVVTGVSQGTAIIEAVVESDTSVSAKCTVTVTAKPSNSAIKINVSSWRSQIGVAQSLYATTTPTGGEVVWSSSDTNIATVEQNGVVTGVKEGTAIITATIKGTNISASCSYTVYKYNDLSNSYNWNLTQPSGSFDCVTTSHAMLLRRWQILNGETPTYTNAQVKTEHNNPSGLFVWQAKSFGYDMEYYGVYKNIDKLNSDQIAQVQEVIKSRLDINKAGVLVYFTGAGGKYPNHAILITDYRNGTFYAADPANSAAEVMINETWYFKYYNNINMWENLNVLYYPSN